MLSHCRVRVVVCVWGVATYQKLGHYWSKGFLSEANSYG